MNKMINQYAIDIQFINVADKGDMHSMADFPYGLALMTAYLRKQGIETLMLQYPTWKKEEYIDAILDNPAHLYGFQASSENYLEIKKLVTIIKENNPNATIIYGGPFVVDLYVALLENDSNLDAVV